jgi:hypothetical protein
VLRFRLMVKRGPCERPQASEGEAQHAPFCDRFYDLARTELGERVIHSAVGTRFVFTGVLADYSRDLGKPKWGSALIAAQKSRTADVADGSFAAFGHFCDVRF